MIQQTEEWYKARLGKVTASRLADVMAKTRSGYGAARKNYMMELICQRLSGQREENYVNSAMQRGIDLEPVARSAYEAEQGLFVSECGFIEHPDIINFGASPDGLVRDDGLIEIKCPNTATHVEFLKSKTPKRQYLLQMQGQMICSNRDWCDFVSYDDRIKGLEYEQVRIDYDDQLADEILNEVHQFLHELECELQQLESMILERS